MGDWIRQRVDTSYTWLGDHVQQVPSAILWFDKLITAHGIGTVLEIGTGVGTLTALFGMRCLDGVVTFDIEDRCSDHTKELLSVLGVTRMDKDAHDPETVAWVCKNIARDRSGKLFLFMDGGNKEKEFALYTDPAMGLLRLGDLVAAHDCGSEFKPERVQALADARNLKRILIPQMDADKTRLAVYLKGGE